MGTATGRMVKITAPAAQRVKRTRVVPGAEIQDKLGPGQIMVSDDSTNILGGSSAHKKQKGLLRTSVDLRNTDTVVPALHDVAPLRTGSSSQANTHQSPKSVRSDAMQKARQQIANVAGLKALGTATLLHGLLYSHKPRL